MDFLLKSIFLVLLLFDFSYCYVILSGGPYCSNAGYSVSHAVPGTTVSITCAVDNPDGVDNRISWSIPSFGVMLFNTAVDNTVDGTELKSTVTYSDSLTGRTNATLSFHAVSVLDKAIVQCRNNENPPESTNCTLFILAPPTAPTSFFCTNITYDSLTLQWDVPTNYGGEEELQYNITGTPGNIGIVEKGNNTVPVENLLPNKIYNLTIRAGNSVGFGEETSVECTTEGERPQMFDSVTVCLDVSDTDPNSKAELIVDYTLCPLVMDDFTPEVTSYKVLLNGSNVADNDSDPCSLMVLISTEDMSAYTVDVCADNSVGSTKTPYRNGAVFHASWLRNVYVTNVTGSSAVIQYTTADCVLSTDLIVELISPNSTMVDGDTTQYYENETTSSFSFTSLIQDSIVVFTLQVIADSSITIYSTNSSFLVPRSSLVSHPTTVITTSSGIVDTTKNILTTDLSSEPSLSTAQPKATSMQERSTETSTTSEPTLSTVKPKATSMQEQSTETSTASESNLTTGSSSPEPTVGSPSPRVTSDMLSIIWAIVGVIVAVVAIIVLMLAIIACVYYKKRRLSKTSVDLLNIKEGSSLDPISLSELKQPEPDETDKALNEHSCTNDNQQAPVDNIYTQPENSRRQTPPSDHATVPELETGTHQDPNTIERQQAPTGDLYALPDKTRRQPPPPSPLTTVTELETDTFQDPKTVENDMHTPPDEPSRQTPPTCPLPETDEGTYQDPSSIERQQAPTGDIYTVPQKKPQCSNVNENSKHSGDTHSEVGLEDSNQPPSQEDTEQVEYIL